MQDKTIIYGGYMISMTNATVEALVVEHGKIIDIGNPSDLFDKYPDADRLDLKGRTLMPAFLDGHSHFTQMANTFLQVSLHQVADIVEMQHRVMDYIDKQKLAGDAWIMARDFDDSLYGGYPSREELDRISMGHPLLLAQKSGHMGMLNTKAMQLLGINETTPQIAGGKIQKKDGVLTGYLEENAFFYYQKQAPMPSSDQFIQAFKQAQSVYYKYGIQTIQEGMLVKEMLPLYQLLLSSNILELDLVAYPDLESYEEVKALFAQHVKQYKKHLRIGGIKIFLDGSPQGKTAWMRTPYAHTQEYGYGTMTDQEVKSALRLAAREGIQLLAHCNGDAACQQFLDCIEEMALQYPVLKELRIVMIHAQLLGIDQLEQVKRLGVIPSFFVGHVYYFGDVHIENFTYERAKSISPANSAYKLGLPFTFHQDAPVIMPDMWETVWCAVNRITKTGVELGVEERIPVQVALEAVTKQVAYQYGEEDFKGTLEKGKQACFILLKENPLTMDREKLASLSKEMEPLFFSQLL